MELAFILVYGSLLGLLAPYIISGKENYGVLLAPGIALVYGFVSWTIGTWAGLAYADFWIWLITMLGMPTVMILGVRFVRERRLKSDPLAV